MIKKRLDFKSSTVKNRKEIAAFIKKELGDLWVECTNYCWSEQQGYTLTINIEGYSFTFDNLKRISELLYTTNINIEGGYREGCPTCGGTRYVELDVRNPTLPPELTI